MAALDIRPRIARPDEVYQKIVDLHAGCSEGESLQLSAKLILVLLNHIGDEQVITEAVELVMRSRNPQKGRPG